MDWDDLLGAESAGGAAAGYGSGLIGGILDAAIGPVMANVNYIRSKSPTNRQTGYARFMAENSPSWAMEGMRKAGLNPILAFGRGPVGGAQVPPQVSARGEARSDLSGAISRGVSSARQSSLLQGQLDLLGEQVRKARNEANASEDLKTKINAEIGEILARQGVLDQEMQTAPFSRARLDAESRLTNTMNTVRRLEIPWSEEQKRWAQESPVGQISRAIKKAVSGGAEVFSDYRERVRERRRRHESGEIDEFGNER